MACGQYDIALELALSEVSLGSRFGNPAHLVISNES